MTRPARNFSVQVTATLHGTAIVRAESEEAALKQVEDLGVPDMVEFLDTVTHEDYEADNATEAIE